MSIEDHMKKRGQQAIDHEAATAARIAELEAENKRLKARLEYRDDGIDGIYCRDQTIAAVEQQLAATQLRVKELRDGLNNLFNDYKQLADSGDAGFWHLEDTEIGLETIKILDAPDDTSALDKLEAGYQARIVELREALSAFEIMESIDSTEPHTVAARRALSLTDSTEALLRYVAGYFKKAADAWEHEVRDWLIKVAEQIEKGEVK